jgi:uncharacterized membrane protein YedE/YeeE
MTEFTPLASLSGGVLIGLAAVLLMALNGRIAGVTGILAGVLPPAAPGWTWRAAFLAGMVIAPLLVQLAAGPAPFSVPVPLAMLVAGGVLVGAGVTFASGCTSGHGVCGLARLSKRSLAATVTFMAMAVATVFIVRHILGV